MAKGNELYKENSLPVIKSDNMEVPPISGVVSSGFTAPVFGPSTGVVKPNDEPGATKESASADLRSGEQARREE